MTTTRFPETLALDLPPISAVDLALYAAASGDLNPLHLDADVARAAGFDKPIAHGMRTMACAGRLFTEHFGASALCGLRTRFVGSARLGDALQMRATLDGIEGDIASYALEVKSASGTLVASGQARVRGATSRTPV